MSHLRQFWRAHQGDDVADDILLADGSGIYTYNPKLVSVDPCTPSCAKRGKATVLARQRGAI